MIIIKIKKNSKIERKPKIKLDLAYFSGNKHEILIFTYLFLRGTYPNAVHLD